MKRVTRWALAVAGVLVGAEAATIALRTPGYQPFLPTAWTMVALLVPGCALLLAGYAAIGRADTDRVGWLLSAAGIAWFAAGWNDPSAGAEWVFAVGRIATLVCPVLAVHAVLRWQGSLRRTELAGIVAGYLFAGVLGGLVPVLFDDPRLGICRDCPPDPLLIIQLPTLAVAASWLAAVGGIGWSSLLLLAHVDRLGRYSPVRRRLELPLGAAGIGVCALACIGYVHALTSSGDNQTSLEGALWLGLALLLVVVAVGSVWPSMALRLTRLRLVRLVVETAAAPGVGDLSATVGAALRDPTARLLYPATDGRLVDANGAPVVPPTALTRLHRGQTTIAYLAHGAGSLDAAPILDEITRATRLTLDNERLHAEHSWQLRQLQDSRRRIVAAADRERRTLERDLHDGAQQSLVALALTLSLAELNSDSTDRISVLRMAGRDVTQALIELRTIARGIYPRELGDEGLDVALEMLAESAVSPIVLDVDIPSRLPATVESAAYFAIRLYLEPQIDSVTDPATVTVRRSTAWLSIDIDTPTPPEDMLAIEDRVGALGGTLTIQPSANADTCAHLELPCES